MRAGGLRHGDEVREDRRVVQRGQVADDGAVRQRGGGSLQMQDLPHRHLHDGRTQRLEAPADLRHACGVGARAAACVNQIADLEDVAPFERSRLLDAVDRVAEPLDRLLGANDFRSATCSAGTRDERCGLVDDHRVFDEHAVRAVVCGRNLYGFPTVSLEQGDIVLPLIRRELEVDGNALDVSDDPFGQPRARAANQRLSASCVWA
jgi:hypothetical protein